MGPQNAVQYPTEKGRAADRRTEGSGSRVVVRRAARHVNGVDRTPAWLARPPEAILAFYCPTNYEDERWRNLVQPVGAEDTGMEYDVLEAVQDKPIRNDGLVGAWEPLSDPRLLTDTRCRIVLHINWKAHHHRRAPEQEEGKQTFQRDRLACSPPAFAGKD